MFTFTPLLGAQSQSPASQSLLEFDGGIKILVDVGWDESFDSSMLKELERQVPTISLILLTHPTLAHLGAFAHCCKHIPRFGRIPVYATLPVTTLGRTLLQDVYASSPLAASTLPLSALPDSGLSRSTSQPSEQPNILLQPPTSDEIAAYFRDIHLLKYSQTHQPLAAPNLAPLEGLSITAFGAGHTLGGTIWHIQNGSESVVYAVDWNQARENVLSSAAWLGSGGSTGAEIIEQLRRPTALICSSRGVERLALSGGWKRRDELLLEILRPSIIDGGTVLIPCDSSARVLEMAYVLEHAWRRDNSNNGILKGAKVYLAGRTYGATIHNTKRMLEWMNESVVREFEVAANANQQNSGPQRTNADQMDKAPSHPFDFKFLKVLERPSQVDRALAVSGPKVFIASDASLEWGLGKTLMQSISSDSKNLVILTDQSVRRGIADETEHSSLYECLYHIWESNTENEATLPTDNLPNHRVVSCDGRAARFLKWQLSGLTGKDLSLYQQYVAGQRQRFSTANIDNASKLQGSADPEDDGASSSSDSTADSDTELQGRALNLSSTMNYSRNKLGLTDEELGINILLRRKGIYDYDVRGKKGRERMFPYIAKRKRTDDFGEMIRSDEYLRAEEREDNVAEEDSGQPFRKENSFGQKRKWADGSADKNDRVRKVSSGNAREQRPPNKAGREEGPITYGVSEEDGGDPESDESDYEPAEVSIQGPVKATISTEEIKLNMKLAFVDYSGLHDKRSLQMLLPLIKPRKLILTSGDAHGTNSLADDCRRLLSSDTDTGTSSGTTDVFTPTIGTTIDASVDTNAWTIKLSQSLVNRLHWQNVRGLGVVTVTGRVKPPENVANDEDAASKKLKLSENLDLETKQDVSNSLSNTENLLAPVLDVLPANMASATRTVTQPLHVGDLRLADLRRLMQASGHTAEFKGEGTLLVDGIIAVRKSGVGKIEIESGIALGPTTSLGQHGGSFYNVKKRIYESLAVVTAR